MVSTVMHKRHVAVSSDDVFYSSRSTVILTYSSEKLIETAAMSVTLLEPKMAEVALT